MTFSCKNIVPEEVQITPKNEYPGKISRKTQRTNETRRKVEEIIPFLPELLEGNYNSVVRVKDSANSTKEEQLDRVSDLTASILQEIEADPELKNLMFGKRMCTSKMRELIHMALETYAVPSSLDYNDDMPDPVH